jgi:hypothetical protein
MLLKLFIVDRLAIDDYQPAPGSALGIHRHDHPVAIGPVHVFVD